LLLQEIGSWPQIRQRTAYLVLTIALLLQFPLVWAPQVYTFLQIPTSAQFVPSKEMEESGDRLIARISEFDGPVWVMMHPPYALQAGKEPSVHIQSLWHARFRGQDPLPEDLVSRIENKYYAAIISDSTDYFENEPALIALFEEYCVLAEILPPTQGPLNLSGPISRPYLLYLPK
jgi:hypothetical protein